MNGFYFRIDTTAFRRKFSRAHLSGNGRNAKAEADGGDPSTHRDSLSREILKKFFKISKNADAQI